MKKLLLIVTVLMIAGGVSAHGYGSYDRYDRGREYHERVAIQTYYNPYIVSVQPHYINEYRRDCDRDRRYDHDRDYRGRYERYDRYDRCDRHR